MRRLRRDRPGAGISSVLGVFVIGSGDDGANFRRVDFEDFPRSLLTTERTGVTFLGTYSSSGSGLTTGFVGNGARTYYIKYENIP